MQEVRSPHATRRHGAIWSIAFLAAAMVALLYVVVLNGGPLYYYDSGGYLDNGLKVLQQIGLLDPAATTAGGAGDGGPAVADDTVNASRSVVYSLLAAIIGLGVSMQAIPVFHMVLVLAATGLLARVLYRLYQPDLSGAAFLALPIVAASLGSLPFYVAYVMPDILTGVLLIVTVTLAVFARQMTIWQVLVALALGLLAVVSHLSHLAIAGLMVPVSVVLSLLVARRRWWLPPVLVGLIALGGATERQMFKVAVEKVAKSEITYYPFITARLIQDRVGLAFLDDHCPDRALATCALHAALQVSDDPMRLTATHIIFEESDRLGSFRHLPPQDQQAVAREQVRFFFKTFAARPFGLIGALLKNTALQTRMNWINMTVPQASVFVGLNAIPSLPEGLFEQGRLLREQAWLAPLATAQQAYYALSLAVIIALVVWPGRLDGRARVLALGLLAGVFVNAFATGAISQPAARYGARAIWLVPYLAAILVLLAFYARHPKSEEGR